MAKRNGYDPGIHDPASVDNIPIEVPLEFREPPTIQDEIRRFIRIEMSRQAEASGLESFEEANDLEFSDDDDFTSANELTEDQEMAMMSVARASRDSSGDSREGTRTSGSGVLEGVRPDADKESGEKVGGDSGGESVGSGVQGGVGVREKGT